MKRRIKVTHDDQPKEFEHLMNMYGLQFDGHREGYYNSYNNQKTDAESIIHVYDKNDHYLVDVTDTTSAGLVSNKSSTFETVEDMITYLDILMQLYRVDIMSACTICPSSDRQQVVLAAISSRDLSKNLIRVKSSNVWSYAINIKDNKAKTGDVICQFKGKNGGPGDIYMYFDVPVKLWRKWVTAPSKGHFFWAYIRNNFYYRKLTGNKRGVLKNAIN